VVHIDFGIVFEQGHTLSTPETVPFRLTRDMVDGLGITGVEGLFRHTCEATLRSLRRPDNAAALTTLAEVKKCAHACQGDDDLFLKSGL
jgi:ataxia telangiectasia mutated family protein